MKKSLVVFVCSALGLCSSPAFSAQPSPVSAVSPAEQAWMMLQAPLSGAGLSSASRQRPADPAEVKAAMAVRAAAFVTQADRAKDFQAQFPQHGKAREAKLLEVRALVNAVQTGDATVEGRLASAVQALRADRAASTSIQVQAVAAYEFSRRTRGLKTHEERLKAIERVARDLAADFPDQPQGFESLLTIAASDRDEVNATQVARDLLALPAPAAVKNEARKILGRFALVGQPLGAELDGANETAAKAALQRGVPTIVYTWATWSPGSLALAADLKQRGLAANIVGLNLDADLEAADRVAKREGLIGNLVYDGRGKEGALAQRLKTRGAAEVFLVDERGVIRDVRGQGDLTSKLKQIGL
jgi:hypothetical protein